MCLDLPIKEKALMGLPVLSDSLPPHGILQARILEWVAFHFSRGSSQSRDRTQVFHIAGGFFTSWATTESHWWETGNLNLSFSLLSSFHVLVAQSCPTLCDPMDYSPPGSFVRGIPQARIRFLCFPAKQPGRAPSESDKCCWAPAAPACLRRLTSRVLTTAGLLPVRAARLPVQEPDREAGSRQTGLAGWGPALGSCD